ADFRRYVSTKTASFPAPKGRSYQIANHNKLLWRYKGMIGVKNGWTSKAKSSFVGAAKRNGHTIIVSIMRHDGYFWDEVADLLDWGFAARGKVSGVGTLVDPEPEEAEQVEKAALPHADEMRAAPATATPAAAGLATDAAAGQTIVGRLLPPVVLGVGLAAGLVWLAVGVVRRRRAR